MKTYKYVIRFSLLSLMAFIIACGVKMPRTLGDPQNAASFGYTPIDPLPIAFEMRGGPNNNYRQIFNDSIIMANLPDETMRLAIKQINSDGKVSFAGASVGYEGNSYEVVIDYMKFTTRPFFIWYKENVDTNKLGDVIRRHIVILESDSANLARNPNHKKVTVPVYIGVGLRMTATIVVNKGKVDLSNLAALGVAAENKQISGSIVIQTLGVSGESITTLIPMPSDINTTTIQNALISLGSIKAKIYEKDTELTPRIIGFYNNIGGGRETVLQIISRASMAMPPCQIESYD